MFKWNLRKVMAEKGIWSGQELLDLLEKKGGIILSHNAVMDLIKNQPRAVRAITLNALCNALDCNPWDIWEYIPDKKQQQRNIVGGENEPVAPYKRRKVEQPKSTLYPEEDF